MKVRQKLSAMRANWRKRHALAQHGMTLVEIMIVVAIIGLMMGTVGVVAYRRFQKAQHTNSQQIITNLKNALIHYAMDNPRKPCPDDLMALKTEKYIDKEPIDAWGNQLSFKCPGEHDTDSADISSPGKDGKEGTEDDINSWEI